ncbi:SWAP/Surp [Pseudocohnilembus persalinus]|uniref:SWAP/Surp n=1 Tax=Pseudocohnilembus persalinus TaxID=266149 RepID=A0A0V0QZQ3_PSEPJ|nr:SWAP/Surp [Pseudocohnilembus persalinus]|eukprot:KRX07549.1 SWAP/Surp [Pseudocohnilembus persalinus]
MSEQPAGIIIPPKDIREVADKTAKYVIDNGENFEQLVIMEEENNKQFYFLKKDDPYRAYYEHKKREFAKEKLQIQQEESDRQNQGQNNNQNSEIQNQVSTQNKLFSESLNQQTQKELEEKQQQIIQERKKLKAPEPNHYIVDQPKGLTQQEIDIIKMTAQFVAKNGKNFVVSLTQREQLNPQFDFLKPTNDLFPYFTKLIDGYSKCLNIRKSVLDSINIQSQDKSNILLKCGEKFEWEKQQKLDKKAKEEQEEEERQRQEAIDWNDFTVVETIDFVEEDFNQCKKYGGNPEKKIQIIQPTAV